MAYTLPILYLPFGSTVNTVSKSKTLGMKKDSAKLSFFVPRAGTKKAGQ